MKIALAQFNNSVGDVFGNERKAIEYIERAREAGARLVVMHETLVPGYPSKDQQFTPEFVQDCEVAQRRIGEASVGIAVIFGGIESVDGKLFNCAFAYENGKLVHTYHKHHLPNYDVFDEKRYYASGNGNGVFRIAGLKIGLNVCEDIWIDPGPAEAQAKEGAELIVNISASPYYIGKGVVRQNLLKSHIEKIGLPIIYVNQVGGQDEIVFDGESYAFNGKGEMLAQARQFEEDLCVFSLEGKGIAVKAHERLAEVYSALKLGLRDYVRKNGFSRAILGLSGGADSALVAAIAADAIGPENVYSVYMPSKFNVSESQIYAQRLANNLGIKFSISPITEIYEAALSHPDCRDVEFGVHHENLQARLRMSILYFFSGINNAMVLNTSNKSESAIGYGTVYGDMAGGFAVISDVPKTLAFELLRYVNDNAGYERIPEFIIKRPPSAELAPNQKDSDALPPYHILDAIVHAHVEEIKGPVQIAKETGIDLAMVRDVVRRIQAAEHKRGVFPRGTKITPRAFGTGRRMPIANGYKI